MASTNLSNSVLAAKFRGCMVGALVGDCVGAPFEFNLHISERVLTSYLSNLLSEETKKILSYTDDTAMTLSVARSLVENLKLDPVDLAKRFVTEFYRQPNRGYGANVVNVFRKLKNSEFQDIFQPAKLQFDGSGSWGNGAAMRIAPVALFGNRKGDEYIMKSASECSRITHTHQNGYNGAILQCYAVHAALELDSSKELDPVQFVSNLEDKIASTEMKDSERPYVESLSKIKEIYLKKQEITCEEIAEYLGNGMDESALRSVPTAIYSFLRGLRPLPEFECSNPFIRTIYFAISVGGDTDTIASMAGSIAGAYHGIHAIPETLQKRCEVIDEVINLADKLFKASQKNAS